MSLGSKKPLSIETRDRRGSQQYDDINERDSSESGKEYTTSLHYGSSKKSKRCDR